MTDSDDRMADADSSFEDFPHGYGLKCLLQKQEDPQSLDQAPNLSRGAFFPWHRASIRTLWNGVRARPWNNAEGEWSKIVRRWMGCIAVCAGNQLQLVQTRNNRLVSVAALGTRSDERLRAVTWALEFKTMHPLAVCAGDTGLIYIFDVEAWKLIGGVTGHGGAITHLTTHPVRPDYILSTSRDFTARMWSLADPANTPTMPFFWPGQKRLPVDLEAESMFSQMSLNTSQRSLVPLDALLMRTGPPGGVPDPEQAGSGMGVCIAVFKGTGDVLGGHNSWVMHADFHPTRPFVVTCGADRAVKIWRVPDFPTPETRPERGVNYHIIERPLFSCTHLHETGVEYVAWLKDDILVSKSKFVTMEETDFHGTVVVWQWLDANRFAPEGLEIREYAVKPSHWDWKESRSYFILSTFALPAESRSGWRISSTFNSPILYVTSDTNAVHIVDLESHQGSPEDVRARRRPMELVVSLRRRREKRDISYVGRAELDSMSHAVITVPSRGGSFQILRAIANPLSPRVLVGLAKGGNMMLWRQESEDLVPQIP